MPLFCVTVEQCSYLLLHSTSAETVQRYGSVSLAIRILVCIIEHKMCYFERHEKPEQLYLKSRIAIQNTSSGIYTTIRFVMLVS